MKCNEIREMMPDLAAGIAEDPAVMQEHVRSCSDCAQELAGLRQTMSVLDEWIAPEPSPYFDVRLGARLREEAAKQSAGWLSWFRRPALAISLAAILLTGITLFRGDGLRQKNTDMAVGLVEPGTAVGDLQALDKNHDLYSDFDVLDDLEVQQNVTANP